MSIGYAFAISQRKGIFIIDSYIQKKKTPGKKQATNRQNKAVERFPDANSHNHNKSPSNATED
jgi:hypothetical protein